MTKSPAGGSANGSERRRAKRRPVLESFSLFVVVPKKGGHRLPVYDVSELGIQFDLDTEGEAMTDFPIQEGESLDLQLYLNQSLALPLSVRIARLQAVGRVRRAGVEITNQDSKAYDGFLAFLKMLDAISELPAVPS